MNDSNKDQDSEEPVEKIVVDLETEETKEETKEETNVQEEVPTIDSITETNANQDSKGLTNQTNVSTKYHRVAGAAYNDNHGKLPTERSERIRSIFTPLQDYQGKEETNKAEETADTIIKADAMTHTFTATNTKKEGTDSQYEETMLASEEMTTNGVISPLEGVYPRTEDGMNKDVINKNQMQGNNGTVDLQIAHEQQEEMKGTDALEGEEHIESTGNDSTEMRKNRKVAKKGTTQEKKPIGKKQGKEYKPPVSYAYACNGGLNAVIQALNAHQYTLPESTSLWHRAELS
jgi:hypothetical protein